MTDKMVRFLNSIEIFNIDDFDIEFDMISKNRFNPKQYDMMIVKNSPLSIVNCQLGLHPCVEINLRRTMGHVALAISPKDDDIRGVMRVIYDGNHYKLRINKLR